MSLIVLAEKLEAKHPELTAEGQNQYAALGKYLADVSKFLIGRMPVEKRPNAISSLKQKLYALSDTELAAKKMGGGAPIGQALVLTKNLLSGLHPTTIRAIINATVAHL